MSIIVAVKTDTKIILGSDKRVTEDKTIVSENESKILIKELTTEGYNEITYEKFLIAFTGAYGLFELLKTFKTPTKASKDTFLEYLYKTFVPRINTYLRKYNFIQDYNGQEGVDWELLIAYKNSLFLVEFNLGIIEIKTPYYAIGAPKDIALGSLYTTNQNENITSLRYMVSTAIRACAAHNVSCNDNFDLYIINTDGEIERFR